MRVTETLIVASTEIRTNLPEWTVSELSAELKRTVEDAFPVVRVRGEVSNYRGPHSSGHVYFSLKDEGARIDAVIWKGTFGRIRFKPEEGLEVIATGRLTTYPGRSSYQIVIDSLEPAGVGALMALLEERKKKFAAEGLFDEARKQLLPYLPDVIGIVTSPTGAVIRDILHRLADRFPRHVLVWPVRVQGEGSADEVAANPESLTGRYLGRVLKIPVPAQRHRHHHRVIAVGIPRIVILEVPAAALGPAPPGSAPSGSASSPRREIAPSMNRSASGIAGPVSPPRFPARHFPGGTIPLATPCCGQKFHTAPSAAFAAADAR